MVEEHAVAAQVIIATTSKRAVLTDAVWRIILGSSRR
jgi:hypothetical protein